MPSLSHEALLQLFRNRPELAPELLREALRVELPAYTEARIESADFSQLAPTEYHADLVVLLVDDAPVLGIVVEVQLAQKSRKRFSAMAHGQGDVDMAVKIALAAAAGVRGVSEDRAMLCSDLIAAALSEAARKALDMLPQGYEFQSQIGRESFQKGIAQGRAAGVLEVLEARGLVVTDADRERVLGCTDLELLARWNRRAITVAAAHALFE